MIDRLSEGHAQLQLVGHLRHVLRCAVAVADEELTGLQAGGVICHLGLVCLLAVPQVVHWPVVEAPDNPVANRVTRCWSVLPVELGALELEQDGLLWWLRQLWLRLRLWV